MDAPSQADQPGPAEHHVSFKGCCQGENSRSNPWWEQISPAASAALRLVEQCQLIGAEDVTLSIQEKQCVSGVEQCWGRDYWAPKQRQLFAPFSPLLLFPTLSAGCRQGWAALASANAFLAFVGLQKNCCKEAFSLSLENAAKDSQAC